MKTIIIISLVILVPLISLPLSAQTHGNQAQIDSLQKQLDALRGQMDQIQQQITALSGAKATVHGTTPPPSESVVGKTEETQIGSTKEQKEAEAALAQKPGLGKNYSAAARYEEFSQDNLAAARMDNAPLDPAYPGYFRLPGTSTFMRIGGYFKSDFIYDMKPAGDTDRFIPATIPVPTISGVNNSTVSVRPTRLSLDFLLPNDRINTVRFYVEADLFGSNATTPRLRHAYAQVKNILIGQSFSNFMDPDAGPDQLDAQGPNAWVSIRNPQLRYGLKLSKSTGLHFSVEKASSDLSFKTPDFNSLANSNAPDGTVRLRTDYKTGHAQLSAVFRSIGAYLPDGRSDSVFGWGINFAGSQKLGADTLVFQGAYGHGLGRYVNDTSGTASDANVQSGTTNHLKAIPLVATYGVIDDRVRVLANGHVRKPRPEVHADPVRAAGGVVVLGLAVAHDCDDVERNVLADAELIFVFRREVAIDSVLDLVAAGVDPDGLLHAHRAILFEADIAVVGNDAFFLLSKQRKREPNEQAQGEEEASTSHRGCPWLSG